MKTLLFVLFCHRSCSNTDWSPIIEALPCICWGVILLAALYIFLKYIASPLIANYHERKSHNEKYEKEKFWFFLNHEISAEDCRKKLDESTKKLTAFEKKEKELNDGVDNLKREKEEFEKTILQEKVKAYKHILKSIGE